MDAPQSPAAGQEALGLLVEQLDGPRSRGHRRLCGHAGVVLPSTPGNRQKKIMQAIDRLNASGSTNGGEGIVLAYRVAQENFIADGANRVILGTDGDFNVGVTSHGELVRLIEEKREHRRLPDRARLRHGQPQGRRRWKSWPSTATASTPTSTRLAEARKVFVEDVRQPGADRQGREDPGRVQSRRRCRPIG